MHTSLSAREIYGKVHDRRAVPKQTIKNTLAREATTASGRLSRVAPASLYALRPDRPCSLLIKT